MGDLVFSWYNVLNSVSSALSGPVREFAYVASIPPLTALLLGVLGAFTPCQLTTGAAAVAIIGRRLERRSFFTGLAYAAGKAVTYAALGLFFVLLGEALSQGTIPVVQAVRKVLGPLMIVVALALLGLWRSRLGLGLGDRVAAFASDRLDATRPRGAFLLGMAFGLAFCPTLFLLFFGLLVPLALASPAGATFPLLFALGTALPVLAVLGAIALGVGDSPKAVARVRPLVTKLAGAVVLVAGINDTVVYWLI